MRKSKVTFDSSDEIVNDPEKLIESLNNPYLSGNDENTNMDLPVDISAINQNPFTIPVVTPDDKKPYAEQKHVSLGLDTPESSPGFFRTAAEEFKEQSTNYKVLQSTYGRIEQSALDFKPTDPNWTPTLNTDEYVGLPDGYKSYLAQSKNPQDFQYRKNWIQEQMKHDEVLENGGWLAKAVGGLAAWTPFGSLENAIPMAAFVKYGKASTGAVKAVMSQFPSITAASAIRNAADQTSKIDGNLHNFLTNTFFDSVAFTALSGAGGAIQPWLDKAELGRITGFAKAYMDDIKFDFKMNEKGELLGYEAKPMNGSVSAAKVGYAQEMANSSFYKGGLFKVPYLGTAALKVLTADLVSPDTPLIGGLSPTYRNIMVSPLVRMLTSKYNAVKTFADKTVDHFITTTGVAKGGTATFSVEHFMKRERASLKSLFTQVDALHFERNGLSAPPRPLRGIWNMGAAFRQKTLEQIDKEAGKTDYITKDAFLDEVQNVLWSKQSSEHDAVNTAASLFRDKIDSTWASFRTAYNLPDTWLPSRTAESYLMRVYNTNYLNSADGERQWSNVISNYLKEADDLINSKMQPIRDLEETIKNFEEQHTAAVYELGTIREKFPEIELGLMPKTITDSLPEKPSIKTLELASLRQKLRAMKDGLQNELRSNPDHLIHVDDVNALSADEGKQLAQILKPLDEAKREVSTQEKVIKDLQTARNKQLAKTKATKTVEKARPKAEEFVEKDVELQNAQDQLRILNDKVFTIEDELQSKAQAGELNPRFYKKIEGSERYEFKNPNERLKFRDTYESDFHRRAAAKAYYNSILNMEPQDIINDTMGRLTGNQSENHLKSRSLMIPDKVLYENNFMSKDLKAKTANYVNYLARRTHIKNAFQGVTINGGFDELATGLLDQHNFFREGIQGKIDKLTKSLADEKDSDKVSAIQKEIKEAKKDFAKEVRDFNEAKDLMKDFYETRLMGIRKRSRLENQLKNIYMSLAASINLHNLPATQITDLFAVGFQHGVYQFVRDGMYPLIQSMGGILKTKDSEAMRRTARHLNLGLNDYLVGQSEKNWGQELTPTLNMGKIERGLEKYAQFTANADLSTYIDNGVQYIAGGTIQSHFMDILHDYVKGTMSETDGLYLRKYGIDPAIWAKRMVDAYEKDGGYKTALGGYQSAFWQWQDLEASNLFGDAVFKGINNTLINKGWGDSPFVMDSLMGLFFRTFSGWGYAAVNRYLIPALQHPDAELMVKTLLMLSAGSLVSPMRRIARGEDAYPDNMTSGQYAYEAFSDSGVLSVLADRLNYANMLFDDKLFGNLKNDKYRNRMQVGLLGVGATTTTKMAQVLGMAASFDFNQKDLETLSHMTAYTGAMYGRQIGDKLVDGLGFPRTRAQAAAE